MGSENPLEGINYLAFHRNLSYFNGMSVATLNNHIVMNAKGVPIIRGTRYKVMHIVMDVKAHGWSPEEIHFQHPDISLAQIHSALAYYWDNREAIEKDIQDYRDFSEQMRKELRPYSLKPLLKSKGVI